MSVGEALGRPELRDGLLWGAAAGGGVLAAATAALVARRRPQGWPIAGLVMVAAPTAALDRRGDRPGLWLLIGVVLLGLAGLLPLPWRVPALVPGALAVAAAIPTALPAWAVALVAVAAVVAGTAGPVVDRRHRPGVGPALLAGTAIGAWACVPDVEQVGVVAGAAVAVAVLALLVPLRLGAAGAAAAAGLVLWAAAAGAPGRPAALVGATAGLGVLVIGVVALPHRPTMRAGLTAAAGQALLLTVTSRIAGLRPTPLPALGIAAGALLIALAAAVLLARVRVGGIVEDA